MTPLALLGCALMLGASMYGLYRFGVWYERRHAERCYICTRQIELATRDWKREGHYWDSSTSRWAHTNCRMDEIERYRRAGGL